MDKFDRNYRLTVQTNIQSPSGQKTYLEVERPFTLEFDIRRDQLTSANVCSIKVTNLSQKNRNEILKDQFNTTDFANSRTITLQAGYGPGPSWPFIFSGNVQTCYSVRQGTEFMTDIQCFDGGNAFLNAETQLPPFKAGTPYQTIIETLVAQLDKYGVKRGYIGAFPGAIRTGWSPSGNPLNELAILTGGGVFIDNMRVNCLDTSQVIAPNDTFVLNSAAGLLGTPVREQQLLTFQVLFEPRLFIGQRIRLDSITGANYNDVYKVVSLHHKGVISEAVCGDAITTVGVYYTKALTPTSQTR